MVGCKGLALRFDLSLEVAEEVIPVPRGVRFLERKKDTKRGEDCALLCLLPWPI